MAKTKYLVIVESPAKAKTIGKYLGPDYKVVASMGHLRDLPKSTMGVDIEGGFIPQYIPVKGREETINELKKAAKASEKVFLATDPDREGEAISWHLKELLGIKDEDVYRVTFNEITKKVVQSSINNPRAIDEDLVDAQQARRILDRIVGYKLSPLLWKKVRRGLSAGRVQSVATRMVVDREDEIRNFVPKEYWHLDAYLNNGRSADFIARYYGFGGKKRELGSANEVNAVKSEVTGSPFIVKAVKRQDKSRTPAPPFITSTLQQEGSRKLGMTPKRTMSIAQQLYEGVDVEGEGTVGLITYMRTDSLRLSDEATSEARRLILSRYGEEYYPGSPRRFKSKGSAQDAHEAIRPSNPSLTPEAVRSSLTSDQYRLYRLIWNRFIASQMSAAVYDSVTADIESAGHVFRATSSTIKFSGFTAVYEEGRDDDADERETPIPDIKEGETLNLKKLTEEQKFTQPPARYTEATLVKAMEESGVGRPSTYAPTVSTILDREYVVKEGKSLRPTPLGEVVTKLMKDRFTDIVDVGFTAKMEGELDNVEKGEKPWKEVLSDFYGPFDTELTNAEKALEGEYIKIPAEETDEVCDVCGRKMVIKSGRFGRFLACPGYPECTFTKPIVIEMPGKCPKCGSRILKRTSRNGYTFYACERGQDCGFMTWDVPVKDFCPSCGKTMFKKSGKGFNKPFCINEDCPNFLPEDKRGYKKKTAATEKKTEEKPAKKTTKTAKTTGKSATTKSAGKKK
ncbi:MAG: type I DNA topoisomerase [Oscillospiraceae bacterium]|nr:type I DNA topoisomerase [Oscillospiraceae bacterium]